MFLALWLGTSVIKFKMRVFSNRTLSIYFREFRLRSCAKKDYIIEDNAGQEVQIKSIEAIKVCGITYSYNERLAYQANIP